MVRAAVGSRGRFVRVCIGQSARRTTVVMGLVKDNDDNEDERRYARQGCNTTHRSTGRRKIWMKYRRRDEGEGGSEK